MGWNFFDTTGNTKKVTLTGSVDLPIGTVVPFASDTIPVGWLLCDGAAVSRTGLPDLFATLGTSYGVGNGSTTFNLPDFRGRVPVGKNAGTFATLGGTGGAEIHTLTTGQLPAHTHGPGSLTTNGTFISNYTISAFAAGPNSFFQGTGTTYTGQVTSGLTGVEGLGQSHNNLQPYQVSNYIIKVQHVVASSDPAVVSAPVPHARVTHNAVQSLPASTNTVLAFNTERWDQGGLHDNVTNNSRLTAPETGLYDINSSVQFAANATGFRGMQLRVNGTTFIVADERTAINGVDTMEMSISSQWRLNAGDYVEALAVQTSGAPLNVTVNSAFSPEFMMVKVSS